MAKLGARMTDFEKGMLFVEFLGTANTVFTNYMTLVFAMVTASYFIAARMHWSVAGMFLAVYTIAALMAGSGVVFAFGDFFSLGDWVSQTSDPQNSALSWLGPVANRTTRMSGGIPFVAAMVIASYLGSVIFFFLVRKQRATSADTAD